MSNITAEGTESPIFVRLGRRNRPYASDIPVTSTGVLRRVRLSNITVTGAGATGCSVTGVPGMPVEDITLSDISISMQGGVSEDISLPRLLPDEAVLVRLGLYLRPVDVLHLKTDQATLGKDQHQLGEHIVDLVLDTVAEVVDRLVVGLVITGQPDEMNVTPERALYLAARVDVVHVAVDNDLEHHPRVVGACATVIVQGVCGIKGNLVP